MKLLLKAVAALVCLSGLPALAQTNAVGPAMAAYQLVNGSWTPAVTTDTDFSIFSAPAVELYCLNTTTKQWVPWTAACAGGGGGGGTPSGDAGGDLGGTYPNPTVTASHIISGGAAFTGNVSTTGNITANGNFIATGPNTAPVNVTTQNSVQIFTGAASTQASVAYINSGAALNNRIAYTANSGTGYTIGFANDAFSTGIQGLTIHGGFASGLTGITSNSGTGPWTHTGSFSATGTLTTGSTGQFQVSASGNVIAPSLSTSAITLASRIATTFSGDGQSIIVQADNGQIPIVPGHLLSWITDTAGTGHGAGDSGLDASTICTSSNGKCTPPTLSSLGHFHGDVGIIAGTTAVVLVPGLVLGGNPHCVISGEDTGGSASVARVATTVYAAGQFTLTFSPAASAGTISWMCDN